MPKNTLLEVNKNGIYCSKGQFYIDPWKPVDKALITHAHADHARWGSKHYLAHEDSLPILKLRLGSDISIQSVAYGSEHNINGVNVSLHPAGHLIGSAQIRVEHKGEVWVVSGDYKLENDGLAEPFEPVKCHTFITECTFGLPAYKWAPQEQIYRDLNSWWEENQEAGKTSVLFGYSLGKAQRLLSALNPELGPVFTHGAVHNVNEAYGNRLLLPVETDKVSQEINKKAYKKAMIVAPPSALGSSWMRKFQPYVTGMASGWMAIRGMRRRRAVDKGFIISDHADWPGLLAAVEGTGAETVLATHGYTDIFSRYLQEKGYDARVLETAFEGETDDPAQVHKKEGKEGN